MKVSGIAGEIIFRNSVEIWYDLFSSILVIDNIFLACKRINKIWNDSYHIHIQCTIYSHRISVEQTYQHVIEWCVT